MSVEEQVRNFILENFLFTDDQSALKNDDSFRNNDILDSTGILELIMFLEEEIGITVEDMEMIPDNLDSVNKLATFINRKRHQ